MVFFLAALPFLSPVFGDNMVLQRDRPNTFWGWSVPGDHVMVHIGHRTGDGIANDRGRWQATVRLALIALAQAYGMRIPDEGPTFKSIRPDGSALRVQFSHADGGLVVHGDRPAEFSLAGPDHIWHWAQAQIIGKSAVRVSAPDVPQPLAVRYAWQANPAATLFSAAGLPAAPFRTDDW